MMRQSDQTDDNLLEVIARAQEGLRKSDRRVAQVILDQAGEVVNMTLANLAKAAQVSEPTVIRFCNAIGCEGYRDLRVKLAKSLAYARSSSHTTIGLGEALPSIITKIFDFSLANLNWAQSRLQAQEIEASVEILAAAKRIEFFGFGASGIVALDAQQKFPLFGVPCGAPTDSHQMFMTASMASEGDVIVAISNTGQTHEVINASRRAIARGAKVIAICGKQSPLSELASQALIVDSIENTDLYTPTVSRLAQLVIIDILSVAVSLRRDNLHHRKIAEMKSALADLRVTGQIGQSS